MKNLLYRLSIFLIVFSFHFQARAQWTTLSTGTTDNLSGLDYLSTGHVWIGSFGYILYSSNNGSTFVQKNALDATLGNAPIIGTFDAIHAVNATSAFATGVYFLGNDLMIYGTNNAAASWTEQYHTNSGSVPRFLTAMASHTTGATLVAVGPVGRRYYSINSGATWNASSTNLGGPYLLDVSYAGVNNFVTISSTAVYTSYNGGFTWSNQNIPGTDYRKVSFAPGSTTGYLVDGTKILKSTDGGLTWNQSGSLNADITALYCISPDSLFIGSNDNLFRSGSSGQYWESFDIPGQEQINKIRFYDNDNGIAVGDSGFAILTSNRGGIAHPVAAFTMPAAPFCQGANFQPVALISAAWTIQWLVNGVVQSAAQNPALSLTASGSTDITLIVHNGTFSDTLTENIIVDPIPQALPFIVKRDTTCYNTPGSFQILNSQQSALYEIYDGTSLLNFQWGNGGMITITTLTNQTVVKPLRIRSTFTNSCGLDSISVIDSINIAIPSTTVSAALYRDTVCVNDTTTMLVNNSQVGWEYYLNSNNSVRIAGTGGTIGIPVPVIGSNTTLYVFAVIPGMNCPRQIGNGYLLVYRYANAIIQPGTLQAGVNQPLSVTESGSTFNIFNWDFGPNATPSTGTGIIPSPPSFSTQGIDTITLYAQLNNTCFATVKKAVYVYGVPAASSLDTCSIDSGSYFNTTTTRMEMDDYNNLMVASFYGSSGAFPIIPIIYKSDSLQKIRFAFQLQTLSNQPGLQGLISGIAADRLGNTYFAAHMTATYYWDVLGKYIRHPNAIVKLDPAGKFVWAIESPYAEISDLKVTPDNKLLVLGVRAWKGFEMQTPKGTFSHPVDVNNKGEAFIMSVNPSGEVLSSEVFGGKGQNGLSAPAPFRVNYPVYSNFFDWDTLRNNLRMKIQQNGSLKICGLLTASNNTLPVYFGTDQVQNILPYNSSSNWTGLFLTNYDTTTGFTQSRSVLNGFPTYITEFTTDNSGNTYIIGRAANKLTSSAGTIDLTPLNYEHQFAVSLNASGAVNWIFTADSMEFKSIGVNADGSANIAVYMTTKFLVLDGAGVPYNFSPSKTMGTYFMRISPTGVIMNGDFLTSMKAYGVKQDVCGNYHGFYGITTPVVKSIRAVYSINGNCGQHCYAAYDPNRKDAGVASFTLSDTTASGPASRSLSVQIDNRASVTITSINFRLRINGGTVQSIPWSGTLNSGDTLTLALGSFNFNRSYNRIKGWIASVNGTTDDEQANDSTYLTQAVCTGPLSGTYSLGCDTCYFDSFNSSSTTLRRCGISGPVTINVEPGDYAEQFYIDSIPNASPSDSIVWTSATGDATSVVLDYKCANDFSLNTVNFNRAKFVSLNHLTIKNSSPVPYGSMMLNTGIRSTLLLNKGMAINILNCIIEGPSLATGVGSISQFMYMGEVNGFRFAGNSVSKGEGLMSTGGFSFNRKVVFEDNRFTNTGTLNLHDFENLIFNRNYVTNTNGVYLYGSDSVIISNNTISQECNSTSTLALVQVTGTVSVPVKVFNNILGNNTTVYQKPSLDIGGSYIDVYHNSISNGVKISSGANTTFRNNLVRSNNLYVFYRANSSSVVQMNYNRFQSNGAPLNFLDGSNPNYLDFSQWRSTTGFDLNSDSVSASYLTYTDMHLTAAVSMPGMALGVTTDIDGQPRSMTTPTIGADEFSTLPALISVWPGDCDSTKNVDNYDFIPVGLYMSHFGYSRPLISNSWSSKDLLPWNEVQISGINMGHADADGNGIVTLADTLPVIQNYGQFHAFTAPDWHRPLTGPEISLVPVGNNFSDGDTIRLKIMVGTAQDPLADVGAIGLQVPLPLSLMQSGSFTVTVDSSFLCPDGNCIAFNDADAASGLAAITLVRTDGVGVNGYGQVGMITFIKDAGWNGGPSVTINFANYQGYYPDANPISLTGNPAILFVTTGIETIHGADAVTLYPNPAGETVNVYCTWKQESKVVPVRILDMLGREVMREQQLMIPGENQMQFSIGDLPSGFYLVQIGEKMEYAVARMIKQ